MARKYTTKNQGRRVLKKEEIKCNVCGEKFLTAHHKKTCQRCVAKEKMKEYRAIYSKNPYENNTTVERICLKCQCKFKSINSYRVCNTCKSSQQWDITVYGYVR